LQGYQNFQSFDQAAPLQAPGTQEEEMGLTEEEKNEKGELLSILLKLIKII